MNTCLYSILSYCCWLKLQSSLSPVVIVRLLHDSQYMSCHWQWSRKIELDKIWTNWTWGFKYGCWKMQVAAYESWAVACAVLEMTRFSQAWMKWLQLVVVMLVTCCWVFYMAWNCHLCCVLNTSRFSVYFNLLSRCVCELGNMVWCLLDTFARHVHQSTGFLQLVGSKSHLSKDIHSMPRNTSSSDVTEGAHKVCDTQVVLQCVHLRCDVPHSLSCADPRSCWIYPVCFLAGWCKKHLIWGSGSFGYDLC